MLLQLLGPGTIIELPTDMVFEYQAPQLIGCTYCKRLTYPGERTCQGCGAPT